MLQIFSISLFKYFSSLALITTDCREQFGLDSRFLISSKYSRINEFKFQSSEQASVPNQFLSVTIFQVFTIEDHGGPGLGCSSSPCQEGGSCEDHDGTFTCFCTENRWASGVSGDRKRCWDEDIRCEETGLRYWDPSQNMGEFRNHWDYLCSVRLVRLVYLVYIQWIWLNCQEAFVWLWLPARTISSPRKYFQWNIQYLTRTAHMKTATIRASWLWPRLTSYLFSELVDFVKPRSTLQNSIFPHFQVTFAFDTRLNYTVWNTKPIKFIISLIRISILS